MPKAIAVLAGAAIALAGCHGGSTGSGSVDGKAIVDSARDGSNWLSYGRTYDEQRFSPLDKVSDGNVGQLGLAWSFDLDTARGQEATPIVVDGVMYVSSAWSKVFAFDAATGKLLWSYDPQVPRDTMVQACCDAVKRGIAV